jgi:enamine deaminase RidA (YjgF/YER057c/UK114 family)
MRFRGGDAVAASTAFTVASFVRIDCAVTHCFRSSVVFAVLLGFVAGDLTAQKKKKPDSDDEGYVPIVAPPDNKKKKNDDVTQTLPPSRELPSAVSAETGKLAFEVSPLSNKGLLSQQTRDALKALLRTNHGSIVKLRAFVAGSGDLRRVGELAAEAFSEKRQPLPALSVVQVGALPMEGAQVVIETIEVDRKIVNPNGVAFLSGQAAPGVAQSLEKLKSVLAGSGMEPADVLRLTCFVSSLEEQRDTSRLMIAGFPGAALNYVQMQREPVTPVAECEAVARLRTKAPQPLPNQLQMALVTSPKLVFTGTQLAFGSQESDLKLAFDRLGKALSSSNAEFGHVVMSHSYVTSETVASRMKAVETRYFGEMQPAKTMLPFEGLPSLDAPCGLDVVAIPKP